MNLPEALTLLRSYSGLQVKFPQSNAEKQALREALRLVVEQSESSNIGVCADRLGQGLAALSSYLEAFGYRVQLDQSSDVNDPVYIKFNAQKMSYYFNAYTGADRGVLVACQSEDDAVSGTYGHFPLDLFG